MLLNITSDDKSIKLQNDEKTIVLPKNSLKMLIDNNTDVVMLFLENGTTLYMIDYRETNLSATSAQDLFSKIQAMIN